MPRITIYIPHDVANGLNAFSQINRSKVCYEALRRVIRKHEKALIERGPVKTKI